MNTELTNLLPNSRRGRLVREYKFRLGVIAVVTTVLLILCAGVLLIPTYVFLVETVRAKETRLASVQSTLSSKDEIALAERLSALSDDVVFLTALSEKPSVSGLVSSVLGVSRPGVTVSGFTYAAADSGSGTLTVSGIAATRDALRRYQLAMQEAPFVRKADLPVSAYAKDTNIAFTITITLAQ